MSDVGAELRDMRQLVRTYLRAQTELLLKVHEPDEDFLQARDYVRSLEEALQRCSQSKIR